MGIIQKMESWQERMSLKVAIGTMKRIHWLTTQLHHVELIEMAVIADKLLPKLQKELEDAKRHRSSEDEA